jgi:hypothetical protein
VQVSSAHASGSSLAKPAYENDGRFDMFDTAEYEMVFNEQDVINARRDNVARNLGSNFAANGGIRVVGMRNTERGDYSDKSTPVYAGPSPKRKRPTQRAPPIFAPRMKQLPLLLVESEQMSSLARNPIAR